MPGVSHRYCVMHLWRNFAKQWKDKELKGAVWECARTTTVVEFNTKMNRLRAKNAQAWAYLNKWPKTAWTKSHFSETAKTDNICNNACESFNAKILKYRGKPIITMLEEIRCYVMRTIANNKMKLMGYQGFLPPVQKSRLEKEKEAAQKWTATWSGQESRFEVTCWGQRVAVDLAAGTCTCRWWQLNGMPCFHACAAIGWKHERPENYVHAWLTMGAYRSTYEFAIQPTRSQQYWEPTPYEKPIPPNMKKKAGRPKKNRRRDGTEEQVAGRARRDATESQLAGRVRRSYPVMTCSRCGFEGHNTRSCHQQGCRIRPKNWVPPPPEDETENAEQVEINVSQTAPTEDIPQSQPTQVILSPNLICAFSFVNSNSIGPNRPNCRALLEAKLH